MRILSLLSAAMVAAPMFLGGLASAAATFDTTLADPPGVYFGTGNVNQHFTRSDTIFGAGNIELGLQAIERFVGPVTPDVGTSLYRVSTGPTAVPGKTGSDWGFVFSVNLGATGLHLSDIAAILTMTDAVNGTTGSFNVLLIPDNAGHDGVAENPAIANLGTDTGFQNSESLHFLSIAAALNDPLYDMNVSNFFTFALNLFSVNDPEFLDPIASVGMSVCATPGALGNCRRDEVPEPAAFALLAFGMVGMMGIHRRRPSWASSRA